MHELEKLGLSFPLPTTEESRVEISEKNFDLLILLALSAIFKNLSL